MGTSQIYIFLVGLGTKNELPKIHPNPLRGKFFILDNVFPMKTQTKATQLKGEKCNFTTNHQKTIIFCYKLKYFIVRSAPATLSTVANSISIDAMAVLFL